MGVPTEHPEDIRMLCFLIELEEKRNRSAAVFPLTFPEEQQRAVLDESKSGLSIWDRFLIFAEKDNPHVIWERA